MILTDHSIWNTDPAHFFQTVMSPIRKQFLNGTTPASCHTCTQMEQHGKISGRQKQLLKNGITLDSFEKSFQSSPHYFKFKESEDTSGSTDLLPVDWQIDLSNQCNSACVFCDDASSSRLAAELFKLKIINKMPAKSWASDVQQVEKLVQVLINTPNLSYIHFVGGETLIAPAFKKILTSLVSAGITNCDLGFTTNLTVWDEEINDLLGKFKQVHLGLSLETLTDVNSYLRYPIDAATTKLNLDRWVKLGKSHNWLISLRTTPTCLSIADLDTVYEYAWENNIGVESCNFLVKPTFMRVNVLPQSIRQVIAEKFQHWINHKDKINSKPVINVRNPSTVKQYILQDLQSYVDLLKNSQDESYRMPELVEYLKKLESSRHNSILTYLPQYEDLFRSVGY